MEPIPLVGIAEIRARLGGISKQRTAAITHKAGFPAPVWTLTMGRVWSRDEVWAWIAENRKALDEPAEGEVPAS